MVRNRIEEVIVFDHFLGGVIVVVVVVVTFVSSFFVLN